MEFCSHKRLVCQTPNIKYVRPVIVRAGLQNYNFGVTLKSLWSANKTLWSVKKFYGVFYGVYQILYGVQIELYGV